MCGGESYGVFPYEERRGRKGREPLEYDDR